MSRDFVPNSELSENSRFIAIRQLHHLFFTVMTFDMTLAIPDAWEGWLQHRNLTEDEIEKFLSLKIVRTQGIPEIALRPTASLFTLFQDARKLAEPRGKNKADHLRSHDMIWDGYHRIWQLFNALYADPKRRQIQGIPEGAMERETGDIALSFLAGASVFMKYSALERTAPRDNYPSQELLSRGVWMPRKPFLEVEDGIVNYLNGQTNTLPYSQDRRSKQNPIGLLRASPRAHKKRHWCPDNVPVDISQWPAFRRSQDRGFYTTDDPQRVEAFELQEQVHRKVIEALGPEVWHAAKKIRGPRSGPPSVRQ
jgi:hypothetical protein